MGVRAIQRISGNANVSDMVKLRRKVCVSTSRKTCVSSYDESPDQIEGRAHIALSDHQTRAQISRDFVVDRTPELSRDTLFTPRTLFSVCVDGFDLFVDGSVATQTELCSITPSNPRSIRERWLEQSFDTMGGSNETSGR